MFKAGQHAQRRRLAAARRTEQRHQRAGLYRERQVMDGGEGAELLAHVLKDN
jgi:hypothetical protein